LGRIRRAPDGARFGWGRGADGGRCGVSWEAGPVCAESGASEVQDGDGDELPAAVYFGAADNVVHSPGYDDGYVAAGYDFPASDGDGAAELD
jgi:hypothetical protein